TFSTRPAATVTRYCASPTWTMNVSFMCRPQRTIAGSAFTRSAMPSNMSLRPLRSVRTERHGWPAPVRRRVRKLQHRPQVLDRAGGGLHFADQRAQLLLRQLRRNLLDGFLRQETAVDDPLAHARERHPHEPASPLARAALERERGAEGHQVTAHVVDRRHR